MSTRTVGPLSGILCVALLVAAVALAGATPATDDSHSEIVSYYADNSTSQGLGAVCLALSSVALLFFLGTLRQALRAAGGDEGGLSTVVLLGGVLVTVGMTIFAGLTFTLADAVDELSPAAVAALNALNSDMIFTLAAGMATFNLALGLAVVRHGGLPRSLGITALVLGVAGLTPLAFFAFVLSGVVVIWASVALLRVPAPAGSGPVVRADGAAS
jgi:hypothetical protein